MARVAEEGAAPVDSSSTAESTSPPGASDNSEVGAAPSLFPDAPIEDEPVLINSEDRRRLFAIARANGHNEEELRRYLFNVYGVTSTSQIHVDWVDAIYKRLRQAEKLFG